MKQRKQFHFGEGKNRGGSQYGMIAVRPSPQSWVLENRGHKNSGQKEKVEDHGATTNTMEAMKSGYSPDLNENTKRISVTKS